MGRGGCSEASGVQTCGAGLIAVPPVRLLPPEPDRLDGPRSPPAGAVALCLHSSFSRVRSSCLSFACAEFLPGPSRVRSFCRVLRVCGVPASPSRVWCSCRVLRVCGVPAGSFVCGVPACTSPRSLEPSPGRRIPSLSTATPSRLRVVPLPETGWPSTSQFARHVLGRGDRCARPEVPVTSFPSDRASGRRHRRPSDGRTAGRTGRCCRRPAASPAEPADGVVPFSGRQAPARRPRGRRRR